jgi:hypothetical protein
LDVSRSCIHKQKRFTRIDHGHVSRAGRAGRSAGREEYSGAQFAFTRIFNSADVARLKQTHTACVNPRTGILVRLFAKIMLAGDARSNRPPTVEPPAVDMPE